MLKTGVNDVIKVSKEMASNRSPAVGNKFVSVRRRLSADEAGY